MHMYSFADTIFHVVMYLNSNFVTVYELTNLSLTALLNFSITPILLSVMQPQLSAAMPHSS